MTFLGKGKKEDLRILADELNLTVLPEHKVVQIKDLIVNSEGYDEEFVKVLLDTIISNRLEKERNELEKERLKNEYELEKLKIQAVSVSHVDESGTGLRHIAIDSKRYEFQKLMHKFESGDGDISLYLTLFERQASRANIQESDYVSHLLGLLPYEMTQLIARETEEVANDYPHIKKLLLKRYKLSPEKFRQKFNHHQKMPNHTYRDFVFELRSFFEEWVSGLKITDFKALKDLIVTDQLKRKVPKDAKDHFLDEWVKFVSPNDLADKLDEYESVRENKRTMYTEHGLVKKNQVTNHYESGNKCQYTSNSIKSNSWVDLRSMPTKPNRTYEHYHNNKTGNAGYDKPKRNEKGEPKCFNCNYYGHISKDCVKERKVLNSQMSGQSGHTQKHCDQHNKQEHSNLTLNCSDDSPHTVTYLKRARINSSEEIVCLMDTGSSISSLKLSAAERLHLQINSETKQLFGFGSVNKSAASTLGKVHVKLEIDNVSADIDMYVVADCAQPYDLIVGRNYLNLTEIAFARIGKNLHIWYANKIPFAQLQEATELPKIMLKTCSPVEINSKSVNFIEVKSDTVDNGLVLLQGRDENLDSVLEIVDGKAVIPLINVGEHKVRFKENQCAGRAIKISEDWIINEINVSAISDEKYNDDCMVCSVTQSKRDIVLEEIKFDKSTNNEKKHEILKLVNEYRDIFALNMNELGCTTLTEMDIKEVEGSKPVCIRPYKTSAAERCVIKDIVKEWRDNGIVSDTRSPYASPVLLVKKKTGESRLVVDFRKLNNQTIKDKFPLPRIDDLLERLGDCKIFTTLDLAHGYLQIPLTESAKLKTAFITPDDTGQFERMIFGLANAPAEFQRLMYQVLGPLLNTTALCYLDDILIPAKDWDDMIERLRNVFDRLRLAKLTLKLSKCGFGKKEVDFLGFVINAEGLKPGPRKIKAIKEFPAPKNVHEVRRFLGLTSFFRRFVEKYAQKAEPLSRLTRKNEEFEWKEEQKRAFEELKGNLTKQPILMHYNPEAETEVHCDASSSGIAGMLLQRDKDDKWHLVYSVSKKTTDTEKKYHSSKLELLAIVWTLDRLRQYLIGIEFTVVTDCQALVYLNTKKSLNPQVARWSNLIQEYNCSIKHRAGIKMAHVDALSRAPVENSEDALDTVIEGNLEICLTLTVDEQILMIQHADPDLRKLIDVLKKGTRDRTKVEKDMVDSYILKRNRLFRIIKKDDDKKLLYVIPRGMRKSIVIKFHDLMGHFSVDRTVEKIKELYWFPSMKRYVRKHISMCFECLLNKIPSGKQQGVLHPIKPGRRPFAIIHLDHLGPFVKSSRGNKELLVIIDNLTRFVRLYPVRDTSAKKVINALRNFIDDFGLPERIISDRGTCFTSRIFEEFCRENGVLHTLNSTQHPQGNGMVERVNRTVLPVIMTNMQHPQHKDWDKHIKQCERNLNNVVNKTTDKTPFEMLHGYIPRFNDGLARMLADEDADKWCDPKTLQEESLKKIEESQKRTKMNYDKKKCSTVTYEPGEIVVVRRAARSTGESTKTQPKYRGPLVVTEVLPNDTYRISQLEEKEEGRFYTTTAHVSQLKSWHCQTGTDDDEDSMNCDEDDNTGNECRRNPKRVAGKPLRYRD